METACFFKMMASTNQSTWCPNPKDIFIAIIRFTIQNVGKASVSSLPKIAVGLSHHTIYANT
jgi:hypothetical protein